MWIQLGSDLVHLETALRVELDGPSLLVRVPGREFRALDPELTGRVDDYLRQNDAWIALRERGQVPSQVDGAVRKATYANLATTTSIQRVDDEYRMYAGEDEFASISTEEAGQLEAALAGDRGLADRTERGAPLAAAPASAHDVHHV